MTSFHETFFASGFYEYTYVVLHDGRVVHITKSRYAPEDLFYGEQSGHEYPHLYTKSSVARRATDDEIVAFATHRYNLWVLRRELDVKKVDAMIAKYAEIIKEHTTQQ